MKKISMILVALAAVMIPFMKAHNSDVSEDKQGHRLISLWEKYYTAKSKDLPQGQAEALEAVVAEASGKRLDWDFFDASRKLVDVKASRNWKDRTTAQNAYAQAVKEYGSPLVTFSYRIGQGMREKEGLIFLKANETALRGACDRAFYRFESTGGMLYGQLHNFIADNWQYALWALAGKGINSGSDLEQALRGEVQGAYPAEAYLDYLCVRNTVSPALGMKKVADKYTGTAVGAMAEADLISWQFRQMGKRNTEDEYKALKVRCQDFERRRKAFKGTEWEIAKNVTIAQEIIKSLDSQSVDIRSVDNVPEGGLAVVTFRNLPGANIKVINESTRTEVFSSYVNNPARRFYVIDTARVNIGIPGEGLFTVEARNGKLYSVKRVERYSLSIALRTDSKGPGVLVADSGTGEPLKVASLRLLKGGKVLAVAKDVALDEGFTLLPENLRAVLANHKSSYLQIEAFTAIRLSRQITMHGISGPASYSSYYGNDRHCKLFTDKGAYNPGETVHTKAVFYEGDMISSANVVAQGEEVVFELYDSQSKKLAEHKSMTNEFGSAAADIVIPKGLRGGLFKVRAKCVTASGSVAIRVDEFVLPTFEVEFSRGDVLYFPGDTVLVKGKVTSYSGHSLTGAKVTYSVRSGNELVAKGNVAPDAEGGFGISFRTLKNSGWRAYEVEVSVTDNTGETNGGRHLVYVTSYINLDIDISNTSDAVTSVGDAAVRGNNLPLVAENRLDVTLSVKDAEWRTVPCEVDYEMYSFDGETIMKGKTGSGTSNSLDLGSLPAGIYRLKAKAEAYDKNTGKMVGSSADKSFLLLRDSDSSLPAKVNHIFRPGKEELEAGEDVQIEISGSEYEMWVVAELFADGGKLLESRLIHTRKAERNHLSFKYSADYPDAVRLQLIYFHGLVYHTYTREFSRVRHTLDMPLSVSSFEDRTLPGREYSFTFKTDPGAECLAAVYDKSCDQINSHWWNAVSFRHFGVSHIGVDAAAGTVTEGSAGFYAYRSVEEEMVMYKSAAGGRVANNRVLLEERAAPEMVDSKAAGVSSAPEAPEVALRSEFATSLAFEPFLRPDAEGNVSLSLKTSDKLSTYVVKLFAHDKTMHNAVLQKEFMVTLPVKVAVSEPKYLYEGDKASISVAVSSQSDKPLSGKLYLSQSYGPGSEEKPFRTDVAEIKIPAGGSVANEFALGDLQEGILGLKAVFVAEGADFSDGVFVTVPVRKPVQTLTESHSAVLLGGADYLALIRELEGRFVNTTHYGAEYRKISVLDMVRDAVPSHAEPAGKDVLSLSEAWYTRNVVRRMDGFQMTVKMPDSELLEKILACRNSDGGFAWFDGMKSSPVITAVMMERFAKLRDASVEVPDISSAASWLDGQMFSDDRPYWYGGISWPQYLYVRSMYPDVKFSVSASSDFAKKRLEDFRKYVASYLVPSGARGLNGQISDKTRRLSTLMKLLSSDSGVALMKAWGVSTSASKLRASAIADVRSLLEYAVEHKDGGWYYPNLVMPYRGLLESEAYSHAMLADLLASCSGELGTSRASQIADGVRLWLMLQKETQKWDETPAFTDAISSILSGSDKVLDTKVLVISKSYEKPFAEIAAAGNGFTISRRFYRKDSVTDIESGKDIVSRQEIKPGQHLGVGDRIEAVYEIWNAENRSFVQITAPREAGLRPVDQLSGYMGWRYRPMVFGGYSFNPGGYRDVRSDRTIYYYESYPEEKTTVTEEFFVTQAGEFSAPVVEIVSLYADHYRANAAFTVPLRAD